MATAPLLLICNQSTRPLQDVDFKWPGHTDLPLSEPSLSVFDRLRGITHRAHTHFTQLREFRHVVVVDPLSVIGLDLDCLLKRPHADEFSPRANAVVKSCLGIPHHFRS